MTTVTKEQFAEMVDKAREEFKNRLGRVEFQQVVEGSGFLHSMNITSIVENRLVVIAGLMGGGADKAADTEMLKLVYFCHGVRYMINGQGKTDVPNGW